MSGIPNIDLSGFGLGQQQTSLPWNRTRIRDMPGATPNNPTARPDFTGAGSFNRMAFGGTQFGIPRPNPYGSFFSTPQFGGSFDTFGSTTGGAFDRGGNGSLYSFGRYNYGNPQGGFGSGQGGPLYRAPQWNSFSGGYYPGGANISPPPPVSYNPPPTPTSVTPGNEPAPPAAPTPAAPTPNPTFSPQTPNVPSPPFVPTTPGFSPTPRPTPIVQPNFPSFGPSFGLFMPPVSDPFIRFM